MKSILIPGVPIAKMRPRATKKGHVYDPNAANEEATLQKVRLTGDEEVYQGPLYVAFTFVFPRPKHHFGTGKNAQKLKDSAPEYTDSVSKDFDNLAKFYCDSFNCIAYHDDRQIVRAVIEKRWAKNGEVPHVQMDIYRIQGSTFF